MTREEHIEAAEELLVRAQSEPLRVFDTGWTKGRLEGRDALLAAQVHSTLALVCPPAEPDKAVEPEPQTPWLSWLHWGGTR